MAGCVLGIIWLNFQLSDSNRVFIVGVVFPSETLSMSMFKAVIDATFLIKIISYLVQQTVEVWYTALHGVL